MQESMYWQLLDTVTIFNLIIKLYCERDYHESNILELAKKENISLTLEQAQKAFDLLQTEDISDEAIEKVTGGWGKGQCSSYKSICTQQFFPG